MIDTFNSWRLSKKMLVAFAVIGLTMSGIAGAGIFVMSQLSVIASRHVERGIGGTETLGKLVSGLREHRIIIWSQMNASSAQEEAKYNQRYVANQKLIDDAMRGYRPLAGELAPQLDALQAKVESLEKLNARIFSVRRDQGAAAALPIVKGEARDASNAAIENAEALINAHHLRAQTNDHIGRRFATTAFWCVIVLSVLGLGALFGIWRLITRTVSVPMAELSQVTKRLAEGGEAEVPHRRRADELGDVAQAVEQFRVAAVERAEADARAAAAQQVVTSTLRDGLSALSKGDLTAEIHTAYPEGYAELKTNFNEALVSLRGLIGSVTDSTVAIRTGSTEIAQASEDLARRTEANAASLEETSAAITQMDGRLKAGADAAGRTVARADEAIATVQGGRGVADEAMQAMTRVSESAKGIDSVIEGLDKIAFQTRVLAMNAAVEAGRAGEAGRGFAVVADLVSALAMRAEEEAGRAREQLTATQSDIIEAVAMVERVDGALADISGQVGEVHMLLGQMAADNQAQSTAITQINVAVGTMDQSTQQNAAMVEETSAAARNLSGEVAQLAEQAARFEIGKASPGARPVPSRKPAAGNAAYLAPVKQLPRSISAHAAQNDWQNF